MKVLLIGLFSIAVSSFQHPVVMIPGLAGSVIKMKLDHGPAPSIACSKTSDWFTAWVDPEELIPPLEKCLLARFGFTFDKTSRTYHDAPGVTINSNVDFGGVGGISYLIPSLKSGNYFGHLADYLSKEFNLTVGENLHGAPYDWRMAPDGHNATGAYYSKLKALIEDTFSRNGNRSVHLVSHSLGGPTTLSFLNHQENAWKKTHIASFIPIAPPWQGSTSQVVASISGDNFGIPFVPSDYLYPVQSAAPSGVFLWPTPEAFGETVFVTTPSKNYTAATLLELNQALGNNQAIDAYNNLNALKLSTRYLEPPGVPTHMIYSYGVKTRERFDYKVDLSKSFNHAAPSSTGYADGDGTVNAESFAWARREWSQEPEMSFFNVSGVSHFGMMSDKAVLEHVAAVIAAVA